VTLAISGLSHSVIKPTSRGQLLPLFLMVSNQRAAVRRDMRQMRPARSPGHCTYKPAAVSKSDGRHPRASAMREMLSTVTFRSPRSIFPMWERSSPAASANASCDNVFAFRAARTASPSRFSDPCVSCCPDTLATHYRSLEIAFSATVFTTHNIRR